MKFKLFPTPFLAGRVLIAPLALLITFNSHGNTTLDSQLRIAKGQSPTQNEGFKKITAGESKKAHQAEYVASAEPAESDHSHSSQHGDERTQAVTKPVIKKEAAPGIANFSAPNPAPANSAAPAVAPAAANAHDPGVSHRSSHAATPGIPADQSLQWLKNGNTRYTKKRYRADGRADADRKRLLAGQKPHAIVLSCADSRVPPEIVFDQALGEIFVIRVAGEALDSSVIASVEYAVEHLGPKLIVVMGHTQCGAVKAALSTKDGDSAGSEALDKLVADIKPRLKTVASEKESPNLEVESTVNADGVARDLVKRSEIIRNKVEAGELKIKPALYRMDSGSVKFY